MTFGSDSSIDRAAYAARRVLSVCLASVGHVEERGNLEQGLVIRVRE